MAGQNIGGAFSDLLKDGKAIAVQAIKKAAHQAQDDVIKEAKNYLQEYYGNYTPKQYKRTYRLKRAIMPYWADRSTGDHFSIEIGVQYNASALKGAYRSNSAYHQSGGAWIPVVDKSEFSSDNGIPEPEWILNNFLYGVHPWAQQDSTYTDVLMEYFLENELPSRLDSYIQSAFFSAITSRL